MWIGWTIGGGILLALIVGFIAGRASIAIEPRARYRGGHQPVEGIGAPTEPPHQRSSAIYPRQTIRQRAALDRGIAKGI